MQVTAIPPPVATVWNAVLMLANMISRSSQARKGSLCRSARAFGVPKRARSAAKNPAAAIEVDEHHRPRHEHDGPDQRIAEIPMQFGHVQGLGARFVVEIHAVDADDERERN